MTRSRDWRAVRKRYWSVVDDILRKCDIVLCVLDSRFYNETRNKIIEDKIKRYGKRSILVLNKSDLVPMKELRKAYEELSDDSVVIPISCRERRGKLKLIKAITSTVNKRPMSIGVVGYPNTGKSSVINYLAGRKKARTSSVAGFTRGMQWIRLSANIRIIDTPGVIPASEKNESDLVIKAALTNTKEFEESACKIIQFFIRKNKKVLEKKYDIKMKNNPVEVLTEIAISKGKLKKQGIPDIEGAARLLVNDWQKGKLKR